MELMRKSSYLFFKKKKKKPEAEMNQVILKNKQEQTRVLLPFFNLNIFNIELMCHIYLILIYLIYFNHLICLADGSLFSLCNNQVKLY